MASLLHSSLVVQFGCAAVKSRTESAWSAFPDGLFCTDGSCSTVAKYGLVAAGVTAVGVTAAVATKKIKTKKAISPVPFAARTPRHAHVLSDPLVPTFTENLKIDDKTKLHYELFGRGPQKVLLIGGFGCRLSFLESFIAELLKHPEVQVCAYDQRLSGLSVGKKEKLTSKILAADAQKLLEHLGWKQAHVFGFSMGGCVAMELALAAPEKIASLYLSATTGGNKYLRVPFGPGFYSLLLGGYASMPCGKLVDLLLDQHHSRDYLDAPALVGDELTEKTVREVLREYYIKNWDRLVSFTPETIACQSSVVSTHFVSDEQLTRLANMGFPITVQYNTCDPLDAKCAAAKRLTRLLNTPNCTEVVFAGAGHFGLREEFPRFLESFMANCRKSGSWLAPPATD